MGLPRDSRWRKRGGQGQSEGVGSKGERKTGGEAGLGKEGEERGSGGGSVREDTDRGRQERQRNMGSAVPEARQAPREGGGQWHQRC